MAKATKTINTKKKFGDARDNTDWTGPRSTMPARTRPGATYPGGRAARRKSAQLARKNAK